MQAMTLTSRAGTVQDMDTQPKPLKQIVVVPVSGVSFRQDIVRTMKEDDRVVLRRDRDNEYDPNAIAIYTLAGDHVGFVSRKVAERFADDPEERWGGIVREVLRGETWGLRVAMTHTNIPDYPIKPMTATYSPVTPPAATDDPSVTDGEQPVYARSGRLLGTTSDPDGDGKVIIVQTTDGATRRYPAALVSVGKSVA